MNRTAILVVTIAAAIAGFVARGWLPMSHNDPHADEPTADAHEDEEPHIPLTKQAFDTLGLRLASVAIKDYQKTAIVPAEVVEFPGVSNRHLTAPVGGEVTAIGAQLGASVRPGDPLFEIRITDERVLDAQLMLVESITRREIIEKELRRIEPLTESGAVRGRQRIDLEYELEQLQTTISLKRDELLVRGLTIDQVERLVDTKQLLRTVSVSASRVDDNSFRAGADNRSGHVRAVAWEEAPNDDEMCVERLAVEPGQTVERGQLLCDLALHQRLYLKGHAFEVDLPALVRLAQEGGALSAEFGHRQGAAHSSVHHEHGLMLRYVANEVEADTLAYPFYVPLDNEVLYESTDESGYRYRTWRHTVGQRAHLLLPTTVIEGQIPLPIDAVMIDGPNAFVFVEHEEHGSDGDHYGTHETEMAPEDHEEDVFIELEPVPVTVLHKDSQSVVISSDGLLHEGDQIAMNGAHQLYQALHADSGGGHDHHHHH